MSSFRSLSLSDLALACDRVLETRDLWKSTHTGKATLPRLVAAAEQLAAAFNLGVDNRGGGKQVGFARIQALQSQDRLMNTLRQTLTTIEEEPQSPETLRAAASRVAEAIEPQVLTGLRTIADRTLRAKKVREAMPGASEALRTVRAASGRSAESLVAEWLEIVDRLEQSRPVSVEPAVSPAQARREAAALLTAARQHLAAEVAVRPDLPRDLVTRVFGAAEAKVQQALQAKRRARRSAGDVTPPTDPPVLEATVAIDMARAS